eukprot:m.185002 g.185002  ORF g.185002 m.185002 type:complete len:1048 (-) comp32214_c7_seq1:67-3210(-)
MATVDIKQVDCLLPTGLLITVDISSKRTLLKELKEMIWKVAAGMPLYAELKKPDSYGFQLVNNAGELNSVEDDNQLLIKLDWYVPHQQPPLIQLKDRKGDKKSRRFDVEIGQLIGYPLHQFEHIQDDDGEIAAFRRNIRNVCQKSIRQRRAGGEKAAFEYMYPPDIEDTHRLPSHLDDLLMTNEAGKKTILAKVTTDIDGTPAGVFTTTVSASVSESCTQIIDKALEKYATKTGSKQIKNTADYVLQVCGREEFLYSVHPLSRYKLLRKALLAGGQKGQSVLELKLRQRSSIEITAPNTEMEDKLLKATPIQEPAAKVPPMDLFNLTEDLKTTCLSFKALEAHELSFGKLFGVQVSAAIFQGDMQNKIGETVQTRVVQPNENPVWNENLIFTGVNLANLPRDAKLCICVNGVWKNPIKVRKQKKLKFQNEEPLAWVNVSLFNHKGILRSGPQSLSMWNFPDDHEAQLFVPHGTTLRNTDTSGSRPVTLKIEFPVLCREGIKYPDVDVLGGLSDGKVPREVDPNIRPQLESTYKLTRKDPLYKLKPEDKELLNKYKYHFKDDPRALSKALRAIDWSSRDAANDVVDTLQCWSLIGPEDAMDLLDCSFADSMTRAYAVKAMKTMTDNKLLRYLLQLVQVLKYELYLDNDLARFLLERALANQRVGHFFFWYLRSEMHLPEAQLRYGLLLEAYCRGCGGHLKTMQIQVDCLNKLERYALQIKAKSVKKDERATIVQECLKKTTIVPFTNPYDPSVSLTSPTCPRVMDSKKLPLWLTFKNGSDTTLEENIIFKVGDDLRQDMLTLQLIGLMDDMWTEQGLDMKMNAYSCLSTGDEVGMLQVVMNSTTIATIQGKVGGAWKDELMYQWLEKKNPTPEALLKAADNFMDSCAGYCVATYVLGIGDRHNDNIMITEDGRLFHIDFGHFLGNFKSKFGIKRERVKFILTPDFVHIICQGEKKEQSQRWLDFKEKCKKAYLIVRRRANLLINLLNMMLSTGIPELQSHDDVAYLRNTLCLEMEDKEAGDEFMREIDQALKDSYSVRINWAFHIAAH